MSTQELSHSGQGRLEIVFEGPFDRLTKLETKEDG